MALVKTVASSAPIVASTKHTSTTGRKRISPGIASHSPSNPITSTTEKPAIQGLRGNPASAMAPSTGASTAAMSSATPVA